MSRGKKSLLMLAVLAVVCAAAWIISGIDFEKKNEEVDLSEVIFTLDMDKLESLSWRHEEETYTFLYRDGKWSVKGQEDFPLNPETIEKAVDELKEMKSLRRIENPENLEDFNLVTGRQAVTVTQGGVSTTLILGELSPIEGYRYVNLGDGNVYMVDTGLYYYTTFSLDSMRIQESEESTAA